MDNMNMIEDLVHYISKIAASKGYSQRNLASLCAEKGQTVSQSTISNMFTKPSSITLSTLMKVCNALDLNLSSVFRYIELSKTAIDSDEQRLIYNINHTAYKGYVGKYHVYFLPTHEMPGLDDTDPTSEGDADPANSGEETLVHGTLEFSDRYSTGECNAFLTIDCNDLTDDGEPFTKEFQGTLVYSTNGFMFCNLISNRYGDMWFLVFKHSNLNNKNLACVLGCAATSSSGLVRYPAIHRFCLCNAEQYPNIDESTQKRIEGILRLHNDRIFVSEKNINRLLENENLHPTFRRNLENYISNMAEPYYELPQSALRVHVPATEFSIIASRLCEISAMETVFHIRPEDSTDFTNLLRDIHVDPRRKKKNTKNKTAD